MVDISQIPQQELLDDRAASVVDINQITLLPKLIDLCNKIAERLPSDSDPVLELKALRDNANEILQFIKEK